MGRLGNGGARLQTAALSVDRARICNAADPFSKRLSEADTYLRNLLIHGARALIYAAQRQKDTVEGWLSRLLEQAK